jgi:MoaA/NifB/PqqE/SkfB family radical SAM enzyme
MKTFINNILLNIKTALPDYYDQNKVFSAEYGFINFTLTNKKDTLIFKLAKKNNTVALYAQTKYFNISIQYNKAITELNYDQNKLAKYFVQIVKYNEKHLDKDTIALFFPGSKRAINAHANSKLNIQKKFYPVGIVVITPKCNVKCLFCKMKKHMEKHNKDRPLKHIKKIIDNLKKNEFSILNFDGGEPTLYPQLPEAIKYAKKKFKKVSIVSNGIRFADYDYLVSLLKAGLDYINFSFVAIDNNTSKKLYGHSVLKQQLQALQNIRLLRSKICLTFQVIVTKQNQKSITKILELLAINRPEEIIIIFPYIPRYPFTRTQVKVPYLPSLKDNKLIKDIDIFRKKNKGLIISLRYFPYCKIPPHYWDKTQTADYPAAYFWNFSTSNNKSHSKKETTLLKTCFNCTLQKECSFPASDYLINHPKDTLKPIKKLQQ